MARATAYYNLPHEPPGPLASHQTSYSIHSQTHPEPHQDVVAQSNQANYGPMRQCSVRGCTVMLPPEYLQKMCESCRGRHRIYASTKRKKRKAEKLAIGGRLGSVVWMPPDSDETQDQPQAGPSSPPPDQNPENHEHSIQDYPLSGWESQAIDPSLFSQDHHSYSQSQHSTTDNNAAYSQELSYPAYQPPEAFTQPPDAYSQESDGHPYSQNTDPGSYSQNSNTYSQGPSPYTQHSELAGALQLPQHHTTNHPPPFNPQPLGHDPPINDTHAFTDDRLHPGPDPRESVTLVGEISAKAMPDVAAEIGGTTPPHRYCSVKGCKAIVPADSFFKMCEPCRNRYRNYGTTKRAKWKREKEAAVAELQRIREEDDVARASEGLPPLAEGEWSKPPPAHLLQAANSQTPPEVPFAVVHGSITPRMCTVSHCRVVLPPGYPFLRCERHRIQNRHHSKLKRVRDKESKAAAFSDWTPSAAVNSQESLEEGAEGFSPPIDEQVEEEAKNYYDQVLPEPNGTSVPPAARGARRTNHVCSIKPCYNLLSPFNPWKMCDQCRSRDRAVRKNKALRDSGYDVEPLPPKPRTPPPPESQKKPRKKKKQDDSVQSQEQSQGDDMTQVEDGGGRSTEQVVSDPTTRAVSSPRVFINTLEPRPEEQQTQMVQVTSSDTQGTSAVPTTEPSMELASKKRTPVKRKTSATKQSDSTDPSTHAVPSTSSSSATQIPQVPSSPPITTATTSGPVPATTPQSSQPHYPYPPYYTMPHYMAPYPPTIRYPSYGTSALVSGREGYVASPVFPSTYGYPSYTYSWSPWGPPPPFPPPLTSTTTPHVSQPPSTTTAPASAPAPSDTSTSVSNMYSTFSSRPSGSTTKASGNATDVFDAGGVPTPAPVPNPTHVAFTVRPIANSKRKRESELEHKDKGKETQTSYSNPATGGPVPYAASLDPSIAAPTNGAYVPQPSSSTPESEGKRLTCTNKSCHRSLPAGATVVGLCEKCKDRIRKNKDTVKRRAKLEPRNLVGRSGKISVHGVHS